MTVQLETTTISSHIIRPSLDDPKWPKDVTVVPLSILDNTCAKFARSCATWIFEASPDPAHFSEENLLASFRRVISFYPFWAGQLRWAEFDPARGYQYRSGRLGLQYGGQPEDCPGIAITFMETKSTTLNDILPSRPGPSTWPIDEQFPSTALIPDTPVALEDSYTLEGLPNLAVKVTRFHCGGVALGIKMTHSLADATSLVGFMHDWAKIHSALTGNGDPLWKDPDIVFDPSLLDSEASGDLSSPDGPDDKILDISRALPLHRYDWFGSGGEDCPAWAEPITACPPEVDLQADHGRARGERMPWAEWDAALPVRHTIFRFSADEVDRIWKAGSEIMEGKEEVRLSRLDTLLAHVWKAVMRANQIGEHETSFLDMTFGFRSRLDLPARFLGSPLRQIAVAGSLDQPLKSLSHSIRSTLKRLDESEVCKALLHDLAYDTTGQNIWATFLGRRHLLCTSWTRLGVYDVDFGSGARPRYVDAFMPASDGLLQIMEASPTSMRSNARADDGRWWKAGASVSLHLAQETMARLIADEAFRLFA